MISPADWTPAEGFVLEPNALLAARETTFNVIVTAGPGAGKTEMLAQRADFLLRTGLCPYPRRILAISFKADASRNLKERVAQRCGRELAARLDSYTFHGFAKRLIDRFRPVLTGDDALDPDYSVGPSRILRRQIEFADMVPLGVQVLSASRHARNAVRNTYSHVFLDEFQDCTNAQYQLIRQAFGQAEVSLTAVGDTKQRIMAWAGALEGIFQKFAGDFGAKPLNLYQNFRSAPRLRRVQNEMVRFMDPPAAVPDEQIVGEDGDVEVTRYPSSSHEAEDLAERIGQWVLVDGVPASEVAVLVSRDLDYFALELMEQLSAAGIPYRNEHQLQDLLAEPATQLILDFLVVVALDREPEVYRRLLRALVDAASDEEADYRERRRWQRYIDSQRLAMSRQAVSVDSVNGAVRNFVDEVGFSRLSGMSADYEQGSRLDDVINATVDRLSSAVDASGSLPAALEGFSLDSAVRILTIHKSKGLEFHTVVVLGVEEETFWGDPDDDADASPVAVGGSLEERAEVLVDAVAVPEPGHRIVGRSERVGLVGSPPGEREGGDGGEARHHRGARLVGIEPRLTAPGDRPQRRDVAVVEVGRPDPEASVPGGRRSAPQRFRELVDVVHLAAVREQRTARHRQLGVDPLARTSQLVREVGRGHDAVDATAVEVPHERGRGVHRLGPGHLDEDGQRVEDRVAGHDRVERPVEQPLLGPTPGVDDEAADDRVVELDVGGDLHDRTAAVLGEHPERHRWSRPAGAQRGGDRREGSFVPVGVEELEDRPTDCLLDLVAEQLGPGPVRPSDAKVGVDDHDDAG